MRVFCQEESRLGSSLAALQEHGAGLLRGSTAEALASLTGYAYLVEAVSALCLSGDGISIRERQGFIDISVALCTIGYV